MMRAMVRHESAGAGAAPPVPLPVLVACAHGTGSPTGRRVLAQLRLDVAAARPGLRVLAAHADVEVQRPGIARVLARLGAEGVPSIVVPLLLSSGYHVEEDIGRAVADAAARGLARVARAIGPDEVLLDILLDRLAECGTEPGDAVVLAAAGSRRPGARGDVEWTAQLLARRRGAPVDVGYVAGRPSLTAVVAEVRARRPGVPVALATYLLAPSVLVDRLASAGAQRIARPLAPHQLLTGLVLDRYDEAVHG